MTDYHGLAEVCLTEAERLHAVYGVDNKNILLIASVDVLDQHFEFRPAAYSQYMKGQCYGYDALIVPGESFFRPVVLYENMVRKLPDKTLILSRKRYEDGEIAGGIAVISVKKSGESSFMTASYPGLPVFYNEDPVQIEDTAPYDNSAFMEFLSDVLGEGGEANADS